MASFGEELAAPHEVRSAGTTVSMRDLKSSAHNLRGMGVLVTRPAGQAEPLCRFIEAYGGNAVRFPVIEILDLPEASQLEAVYEQLQKVDLAIFISANAVRNTADRILKGRAWPSHVQVSAVGPSTIKELKKFGLPVHFYPQQKFNSEGLLELVELQQVRNKKIVIFRGKGGRDLLGETLRERGAELEYVEVYRRAIANSDANKLINHFESGKIDVITLSSLESLGNLIQLAGVPAHPWLCKTPMVVINNKMAELVRELGSEPIQAHNATDEAIMEALLKWSKDHS